MVDRAVVTDLRRLTKDDAHTVVDKELAPDLGAGVDLDAGQVAAPSWLTKRPGRNNRWLYRNVRSCA